MSFFNYMWVLLIAVVGLVVAVVILFKKVSAVKVGFGMKLAWSQQIGGVVVLSRLVNSPAGRNGVASKMILVWVNKERLDSKESFLLWQEKFQPELGTQTRFVFYGEHGAYPVEMYPELVHMDFPAYWNPDEEPGPPSDPHRVKTEILYDNTVGEYYTRKRVRVSAIKDAFFR